MSLKKVTIYQRILPHYRVPFFERLYEILLSQGVELTVIYGKEKMGTVPKTIYVNAPWAVCNQVKYIKFLGAELVIQYIRLSGFKMGNIIIIEQANRLLINYLFYFLRAIKVIKLGVWGHGKNFQSLNQRGFKERFKKLYSTFSDWWFCYTEGGKRILIDLNFPTNKITVVNNSIDVNNLITQKERLTTNELTQLKVELNITGDNVGVYCGGMYSEKNISFLLDSCKLIRHSVANFEIIFIGNGPDEMLVSNFCANNEWAHYVGAISGVDRVKYFSISKVMLMPGLVGLAVLDSFALQVPMVTTNIPIHSPEAEYLLSGVNGLITEPTLADYTQSIIHLLKKPEQLELLRKGCRECIELYSIEAMAQNYADGIAGMLKR